MIGSKLFNIKLLNLKNWKDILNVGDDQENLFNVDTNLDTITDSVRVILQAIIGGLITTFFLIVVYGAFTWITAGDSEEKLAKAKKIMKNGVIGLFMVMGFLIILGFISFVLGINIIGVTFNFGDQPVS